MATMATNLQQVQERIARACDAAQRPVQSVTLLGVTKTVATETVREAHACGLRRFGENHVHEAVEKMAALADLRPRPEWHLIGPLQSNKTRLAAERFDWVHSVDRVKVAERLSAQRPAGMASLQVCLQVNISGEASKSGFAPSEVAAAADAVVRMHGLQLRGLMAIPRPVAGCEAQRRPHRALRELLEDLRARGHAQLDTLSMGMSDDLEAAIAEGATIVRVGTAIFGRR